MLSKKIRRIIYELSKNSRIRTKDLGKSLKASQQSASYLISSLKDKNIILDSATIIDPSKIGYISILVYYNYTDFTAKGIHEILSFLKNSDIVTTIEQLERGYDLACVFCVPNLSNFNKVNRDFLQNFKGRIFVSEIFPIVVRHIYPKKYLVSQRHPEEFVISGDRDIVKMSAREKAVAKFLYEQPDAKIIEMAKKLRLNPKSIIKLKQRLEDNKIIRGYETLWDYNALKIERKHLLISSEELPIKEDKRLLEFTKLHPNIIALTKLIGRYDLLIKVEGENLTKKDVLKEFRSEFNVKYFRVLEGSNIVKQKYVPSAALK